jgi:hypothetical protein
MMHARQNRRQVGEQLGLAIGAIALWVCLLLIVLLH